MPVPPQTTRHTRYSLPEGALLQLRSVHTKYEKYRIGFQKNAPSMASRVPCLCMPYLFSGFLSLMSRQPLQLSQCPRPSVQFSSVAQLCLTLCDPMDCSTPGFPVHHQLPELAQTHVLRVSDVIQPSHPLFPPSPPTYSFSQHRGLFK